MTFSDKNQVRKIFCVMYINLYQFLVAKVWWQNLDYVKNLQAKYFTSENIPIYSR